MALSIKTEEADRLARDLARLTGETMTQAVTVALRERLERHRRLHLVQSKSEERERINRVLAELDGKIDKRPVLKAEWDALWGESE
jgi:antitoxin VapB